MSNDECKHPDVEVELVGHDGNAFAILGAVSKALRRAGTARTPTRTWRRLRRETTTTCCRRRCTTSKSSSAQSEGPRVTALSAMICKCYCKIFIDRANSAECMI